FNQALMLALDRRLDPVTLAAALHLVAEHHDGLRLRFHQDEAGSWQQQYGPTDNLWPLEHIDLTPLPQADRRTALEAAAGRIQASLDLEHGPLARAALFELDRGEPQRLLLVCHHLVVDGVSWRVLLDDLLLAYRQRALGQSAALPPRSASFRRWADHLLSL